ncbi:MAG: hypothetical protein IIC21_03950 [Chloroflexi bacterium]|nr:hypothetical protein [Chloroflexota bacterium]
MFPLFGLIFSILPIILLIVAIYGIVAWRRRRIVEEADPGIGTVRRLYFYIVSFVALMMASNGVVLIIRFLLDSIFGGPSVSSSVNLLAGGASLVVIGLPLWGFHWWFMQRTVSRMPVETRSILRKFYIYVVLGVSIGLTLNAAVELLQWAFQTRDFTAYHIGAAVVWIPVWFFHWRLEQSEGQPSEDTLGIRRLYIYLVSLATLIMLAAGLGRTVHLLFQSGYDALVSTTVLLPDSTSVWRSSVRDMLAIGIVGAAAWSAHWLYFARRDYGSWLRQLYLYLFAVLGGIVTMLVALGITINNVFTWLLGVSTNDVASLHFNFLPGTLAALAVGFALWSYHWMVARREAESSLYESRSAQRVYSYILSAIGLGTVSIGIFALMTAVWGVLIGLFREVITGKDLWHEALAASLTLAIIGLPLWGYYWAKVQRSAQDPDTGDLSSLSRRVFIFGALVVGVLLVLGSASTLLFFLLRDTLGTGLDLGPLQDVRVPLSIIVAAVFFLVYYWGVYRQDRAQGPEREQAPPTIKDVTMLIGPGGESLVNSLENALGYSVRTMHWTDQDAILPSLSDDDCREVARKVSAASGSRVLVIPESQSLRVLSYR